MIDEPCVCECVCITVSLSVYHCMSLASDSSKTIELEGIINKLGMIAVADTIMHHVFIILTLTFIQLKGHTDVNQ